MSQQYRVHQHGAAQDENRKGKRIAIQREASNGAESHSKGVGVVLTPIGNNNKNVENATNNLKSIF